MLRVLGADQVGGIDLPVIVSGHRVLGSALLRDEGVNARG